MLQRLRCQHSELKSKDAKNGKITFQLAQMKAWKFGAKTEAMNAEHRRLLEETLVEDDASLQAQLDRAGTLLRCLPALVTTANPSLVAAICPNTCDAKNINTNPRTPTARTPHAVAP